jgi:hypothetical protein
MVFNNFPCLRKVVKHFQPEFLISAISIFNWLLVPQRSSKSFINFPVILIFACRAQYTIRRSGNTPKAVCNCPSNPLWQNLLKSCASDFFAPHHGQNSVSTFCLVLLSNFHLSKLNWKQLKVTSYQ